MKRFDGKCALVTGGTKGIGKACALQLAEEGAQLIITYSQDDQAATQTQRQIAALGARVTLFKVDLGSTVSLSEMWQQIAEAHASPDVLLLNAAYQRKATFAETEVDLLRKTCEVNILGNFHLAKLFIANCEHERKAGAIVVHSSNQGELVNPSGFAYALTKAALNHMVRHLAVACARSRIRVNGVILGWFDTEGERRFYTAEQIRSQAAKGILMGRAGEPEEAARLTVFLASEDASYITGSLMRDDGGFALAPDLST
jgi:glucose 1-dehydrogenase